MNQLLKYNTTLESLGFRSEYYQIFDRLGKGNNSIKHCLTLHFHPVKFIIIVSRFYTSTCEYDHSVIYAMMSGDKHNDKETLNAVTKPENDLGLALTYQSLCRETNTNYYSVVPRLLFSLKEVTDFLLLLKSHVLKCNLKLIKRWVHCGVYYKSNKLKPLFNFSPDRNYFIYGNQYRSLHTFLRETGKTFSSELQECLHIYLCE